MRTLALVLATLLPAAALADLPADAPVQVVKSCVVDNPKAPTTGHGVWMSDTAAVTEAKTLAGLKAENDKLVLEVKIQPWLVVSVGAALLGLGGLGGYVLFHRR